METIFKLISINVEIIDVSINENREYETGRWDVAYEILDLISNNHIEGRIKMSKNNTSLSDFEYISKKVFDSINNIKQV